MYRVVRTKVTRRNRPAMLVAIAAGVCAPAACHIETDEDFTCEDGECHGRIAKSCPPEPKLPPDSPPTTSSTAGTRTDSTTSRPAADAGSGAPSTGISSPPAACPAPAIDRWKSLLIIDGSLVRSSRARNDVADAPWSFRRRMEDVAGGRDAAAELAYAWLEQWKTTTEVPVSAGSRSAPRVAVTPRPGVEAELLCPWLRTNAANACQRNCEPCAARRLDLSRAPFALLAIVNRQDLGAGQGPCGRDGGELRFIYGALDGNGRALPMTAIFEYQVSLPPGETRRAWAAAWQELSALPFGDSYASRLERLLARGLQNATLRRVLTNEVAFGRAQSLPWEMRQFVPVQDDRGVRTLQPVAVSQTPRLSLNDSTELGAWLEANRRAILEGDNVLSADMIAGTAIVPSAGFEWRAPGAEASLRVTFNRNTCNGCHAGRTADDDVPFQHVAAREGEYYGSGSSVAAGPTRVSKFLHNPGRDDELGRRATVLQSTLCGACATYP